MQVDWLIRHGRMKLTVLALGWAADPRVVRHMDMGDGDVLCLCDYRTIESLAATDFEGYGSIRLVAWSFGVWVASAACGALPVQQAVALCGTPCPVDDRYGIPRRAMQVTLDGIRTQGIDLFCRRAYGDACARFDGGVPCSRPLATLADELQTLVDRSTAELYTSAEPRSAVDTHAEAIRWTAAVVSGRDRIFPPSNQQAYWADRAVCRSQMGHYPFATLSSLDQIFMLNADDYR